MNWFEETLSRMDDWDIAGMAFCLAILGLCLATFVWSAWRSWCRKEDRKWLASMKEEAAQVKPFPRRGPTIRLAPDISIGELIHKLRSSDLVLSNDPGTGQLVLHRRKQ